MEQKEQKIEYLEWQEWLLEQNFKSSQERHKYVPYSEQNWLQTLIYPMFYDISKEGTEFSTPIPFPLILKDYGLKKPKYVIDNEYFTIIFFSYMNMSKEACWEVSMKIKNHDFCDSRIRQFKCWYRRHYGKIQTFEMEEMPLEFLYPKLSLSHEDVKDFSVEFWGSGRDFILFKLFDLLSLF